MWHAILGIAGGAEEIQRQIASTDLPRIVKVFQAAPQRACIARHGRLIFKELVKVGGCGGTR